MVKTTDVIFKGAKLDLAEFTDANSVITDNIIYIIFFMMISMLLVLKCVEAILYSLD